MTQAIDDIIERLERADKPDRELGFDILRFCGVKVVEVDTGSVGIVGLVCWPNGDEVPDKDIAITSSIGAALGLVERMLPGWHLVTTQIDGKGQATLSMPMVPARDAPQGKSPPLDLPICNAILIAMFRALKAQEGQDG
jgi:hypothetical protein